jgi:hypothetical protein
MSNPWQIATWRFEMISALLDQNLTEAQKRRIIHERTKRAVKWPNSPDDGPIGKSTLLRWLKNYREKGFLGLMPKVRKDKGLPRSDRSLQVNYALGLLYEQPERSLTQLMLYLELEFGKLSISRSTLSREEFCGVEKVQTKSCVICTRPTSRTTAGSWMPKAHFR